MKDLLTGIEFLNIPTKITIAIIGLFFVLQIIGELLEFKGKMVPEFIKVRKYFIRKQKERETLNKMIELLPTLQEVPGTLKSVQGLLSNVDCHYKADNISMRDGWMQNVNNKLEQNDQVVKELNAKMDKANADIVTLIVENQRNAIINFAARVVDDNNPATREEFRRIFSIYDKYEETIEKNGLTNDEVNISYQIINEAYTKRLRTHSFIEDVKGYK